MQVKQFLPGGARVSLGSFYGISGSCEVAPMFFQVVVKVLLWFPRWFLGS